MQKKRLNSNLIYTVNDKVIEKTKISTWLLAFYLILAPLDFLPVISGVSIEKLLIFIPLFGCIFSISKMKVRIDRFILVPILYVMMIMVTIFYSYEPSVTQQRIISITLNIAVILVITLVSYNKKEIEIIKKATAYSGWLTLVLMFFYSNTDLMGGRITVVVNGAFQDPNYLTGFLMFPMIYYYDDFMQNRRKRSIFIMSLFLVFVLLTGSRGGLLAILGSISFYSFIWMRNNRYKTSTIIMFICSILILGVLFNLVMNVLPESIAQRFDTSFTLSDGGAGRFSIWENLLYNYRYSPEFNMIFGWGAGTIRNFTYSGNVAHNIWIESLIETGTIGVSILFTFYFIYFKKAYVMKEFVVVSSFVGYMIMGMSLSLYSYKPIWNIILMIMIIKNYRNEFAMSKKNQSPVSKRCFNESKYYYSRI